jgi:hypothetical protein
MPSGHGRPSVDAMGDTPRTEHTRPEGASDAAVEAVGKLTEALEIIEEARGQLYTFHRRTGEADFALDEAAELFRKAGHEDIAERLTRELIGRNVLEGRWTFQIVEEYDAGYYAAFKEHERAAREALVGGRTHLFEAELKEQRRTHGQRHHEATPD